MKKILYVIILLRHRNLSNYRITNGTAAAMANDAMKNIHLNSYYYSQEPYYSRHMSYIVPKGSPLKAKPNNY